MTNFLQYLFSGLTLAAVYALIAIGWSLAWSVARVLNLMVGEYFVVSALACAALYQDDRWPLAAAGAAAIGVALAAGAATDVVLRVTRARDTQSVLIVTLALALMTQEAAAIFWGRDSVVVGSYLAGRPFEINGAYLSRQVLLVVVLATVLLAIVGALLRWTRHGHAMRACAENPVGALWCGIRPLRMRTATILLSAAMAGFAGVVFVPLTAVSFASGIPMAIKGLIAAILGGLGSTGGAVAGALVVGIGEAMIAGYLTSERASGVLFIGLVLLLLAAPNGMVAGFSNRLARRS